MKKILTVIILFLLVLFNSTTIFAAETNSFVEGNAEILSLDNSILREMSSNGSSKKIANSIGNNVIFEYKPYAEILLDNNDEKEVAKMYYYKNEIFYEDTLSTYSVDKDIIESEILEFYHDRFSFFQQIDSNIMNSVNTNSVLRSSSTDLFSYVTSGYKRISKKPYGYMDHSYTVKKYRVNDKTSLYIVETDSDFVPGKIAYANGDTSYSEKMRNDFGYVHLIANQAVEELDQSTIHYGANPYFKDAWPLNSPGTITISSTVEVGLNLGYSFKNGFSLDNTTMEEQGSIGANIGYSYSKSYTNQEPRLTTQHSSIDYNEYQWSFQYEDGKNGNETFHLRTGYMFEMSNTDHSLIGEGQFGLEYNFRMTVKKWTQVIFWIGTLQDPFDGTLYVNWW